jgi:hypothetical protein
MIGMHSTASWISEVTRLICLFLNSFYFSTLKILHANGYVLLLWSIENVLKNLVEGSLKTFNKKIFQTKNFFVALLNNN